jgi:hypothetical protein
METDVTSREIEQSTRNHLCDEHIAVSQDQREKGTNHGSLALSHEHLVNRRAILRPWKLPTHESWAIDMTLRT